MFPSTKFQLNLIPLYTFSFKVYYCTLNKGLLIAAYNAQPLATDSLELRVLDGSILNTSLTAVIKKGILDPPPIN